MAAQAVGPHSSKHSQTHSPQLISLDSQKETVQQDFYLMFYQFFLLFFSYCPPAEIIVDFSAPEVCSLDSAFL